jgi:hypothetical protein
MIEGLPEPPLVEEVPPEKNILTGEVKDAQYPGPDRKVIDQITVVKLARLHCTISEIAEWFDVHEATIRRRFGTLIKQCQAETRARLRQEQLKLAMSGNATMLIFLGKVMLHQREDAPADIEKILPWTD